MRDDNSQQKAEHEDEEYHSQQEALPPHKRDGWAEKMYEMADDLRDEMRYRGMK